MVKMKKYPQQFILALTTEEYEFFQDNTPAFYNQRNIRTKTVGELLIMDEDSAITF